METNIFKQVLPIAREVFKINLPEHAELLSVGVQYGKPVLWYTHDEGAKVAPVKMACEYTGLPLLPFSKNGAYLASCVLGDGDFVVHYYIELH